LKDVVVYYAATIYSLTIFLSCVAMVNVVVFSGVSLNTVDCGSNNVIRCNSFKIKFRPNIDYVYVGTDYDTF